MFLAGGSVRAVGWPISNVESNVLQEAVVNVWEHCSNAGMHQSHSTRRKGRRKGNGFSPSVQAGIMSTKRSASQWYSRAGAHSTNSSHGNRSSSRTKPKS